MVDATIELHRNVMQGFLPSAVKFHYQFNLRELSNITQVGGMLFGCPSRVREGGWVVRGTRGGGMISNIFNASKCISFLAGCPGLPFQGLRTALKYVKNGWFVIWNTSKRSPGCNI